MEREKAKVKNSSPNKIVVGLCTYHRNELLDGALESASRLELPPNVEVEFILVDNDPNGGAKPTFDYYADIFPFKSHYFIEPNQGLVYVRNRVLDEAIKLGATEIAFFDDDEIVASNWLRAYWEVYSKTFTSGCGGSVYRLLPLNHDPILEKFWGGSFSLYEDGENCLFLTHNCFFSADIVKPDGLGLRFDPFFNQIGGEDAKFVLEAASHGLIFNFVKEAIVIERFPEKRATFSYLLKRHFDGGGLIPLAMRRLGRFHIRGCVRSIFCCLLRTVLIPVSLCFGRFQFWKNLVLLSAALGEVLTTFGYSHKYYKPSNYIPASS
ncbi:MAG: glycosyltransferase family 2 protein [Puniceicoccales bacterium]|nr:glycosyltransferase family 2 protein [Puniceicoccales bacterium]